MSILETKGLVKRFGHYLGKSLAGRIFDSFHAKHVRFVLKPMQL